MDLDVSRCRFQGGGLVF
jgi:hypothetical protein